MDFQQYYDSRKKLVDSFLEKRMGKPGISTVDEAMKYSLLAGGETVAPDPFNGSGRCRRGEWL